MPQRCAALLAGALSLFLHHPLSALSGPFLCHTWRTELVLDSVTHAAILIALGAEFCKIQAQQAENAVQSSSQVERYKGR